jgi:hypothetical protein
VLGVYESGLEGTMMGDHDGGQRWDAMMGGRL